MLAGAGGMMAEHVNKGGLGKEVCVCVGGGLIKNRRKLMSVRKQKGTFEEK